MDFRTQFSAVIFAFVFSFALVFSLNAVAQEGQDSKSSVQNEQEESPSAVEKSSYTLRKMLVTATKRVQLAQDVPFSLNVQSEEDIKRLNTTGLEDLSRNVAGFSIQNLGPGQSVVTVRGVSSGQIVRDQPGVKEQVGVYLDETPISLSLFTPDIDLFDLNRVETLRGPQGTLFGSGSIGGTVRYITNQPILGVNEAKVEIDGNYLDEGSLGGHLKTALNIPLGEDAAVRLVAYGTKYGGFIDARKEGGKVDEDVNDGTRQGGRIALLWKPTENLSITPRVVYQNIDLGGFNRDEVFNLFANPYTVPPTPLGEREQFLLLDEVFEEETLILDTVVKWDIEDIFAVSYSVGYLNRDILVGRDASALTGSVSLDLKLAPAAVTVPSNLLDTTDLEQWSHELRLSSNDGGRLQWLTGVFYQSTKRDYRQTLPTPGYDKFADDTLGEGTSDGARNGFPEKDSPYISYLPYDIRQVALFGESTLELSDGLALTAGLRWYDWEEERSFISGGIFSNSDRYKDKTKSNGFTPRFLASWALTDQVTVNAQASRGFRLGGVNDPLNKSLCTGSDIETFGGFQSYNDETLWNYEFGFKSFFEKAAVNMAVFYSDIKDLQVTLDAGTCSSRISFNVPEAHAVGSELEIRAFPADNLLVTFTGSYIKAQFDSTVTDGDGNVVGGVKDGNRLASVPDWQFSTSGTYTLPGIFGSGESYISVLWQYVGDRITQPGDQQPGAGVFSHGFEFDGMSGDEVTNMDLVLDPYHLLDLSLGLVYDRWEFVLYAKNVTDENVKLSFDRERGGRARLAYRVGQPRTFGAVTRMHF